MPVIPSTAAQLHDSCPRIYVVKLRVVVYVLSSDPLSEAVIFKAARIDATGFQMRPWGKKHDIIIHSTGNRRICYFSIQSHVRLNDMLTRSSASPSFHNVNSQPVNRNRSNV